MNKKSNVIKKFFYSIYDVDSFRNFIKEGLARAIVYALFLSILVGGARGIIQTIKFNDYVEKTIENLRDDKYQFIIEDDKLNIEMSPIEFRESDIYMYIDKNITTNDEDAIKNIVVNEDSYLLLLQDGIIAKTDLEEEMDIGKIEVKYSEIFLGNVINNAKVIESIEDVRLMLIGMINVLMIIKEFIFCLTLALVISFLTMIPSRLLKSNLTSKELVSLSIYAYTLPSILVLILNIIIPDVNFDTATMIGTLAYTYLLIRHIKIQDEDDIKL